MIDLDSSWRLVITLVAFGVIPLLLMLGWVVRITRNACTRARDASIDMLLCGNLRGHRHRKRRRHTLLPVRPGRAPGPTGRHSRYNS